MRPRVFGTALVLLGAVPALHAQSLLYRPSNLGGTWVPDGGVVQFNFVHRFYVAPADGSHKVSNFPTFTLALGLGHDLGAGLHYGTNSLVVANPYQPNETEAYARWRMIGTEGAPGFTVSLEPAYNFAAQSADGELSVDYTKGMVTLTAAARGMSHAFGQDEARAAVAGGLVTRLTRYIAVSGDVASFVGPTMRAAWSAGLALLIPNSPHTLSLQASNATTGTIEGSSIGYSKVLYGFEFTIPLHLSRFAPWFHSSTARASTDSTSIPVAVEVRVANFRFTPDSVTITAGQAVRWTNTDHVGHAVTFTGDEPGSSLASEQGTFTHRFEKPGVYRYHCTPHPSMRGVVVVR